MTINPTSIQSQDIRQNYDVAIELLTVPPVINETVDVQDIPGKIYGWYDTSVDSVRLYVVDSTGYRYLRV